ncbi:MAG: RDD family protein [Verrucomicrobiales bacterium]
MEFYLSIDGERRGPFSMFKVGELLDRGEVDADTLAWHRDLDSWRPIREVSALDTVRERQAERADAPPALPDPGSPPDSKQTPETEPEPAAAEEDARPGPRKVPVSSIARDVRPFVRFWARMFDYTLVSVLVLITSDVALPEPVPGESFTDLFSRYLQAMKEPEAVVLARTQFLAMIGWHVLEAILIHLFATTPGKALFGLKVQMPDESRVQPLRSLGRSFYVYILGAGFYQVPFSIIGMTFSFFRLLGSGQCLWDQHLDTRVEHTPLGLGRIVLAILAFLALIMLQSLRFS